MMVMILWWYRWDNFHDHFHCQPHQGHRQHPNLKMDMDHKCTRHPAGSHLVAVGFCHKVIEVLGLVVESMTVMDQNLAISTAIQRNGSLRTWKQFNPLVNGSFYSRGKCHFWCCSLQRYFFLYENGPMQCILSPHYGYWCPGGRFNNTYELLNLRALKISKLHKNHIFQCMGKIFCVEFQRVPLKFHTKYITHTLKDVDFIHIWKFKSS